MRTNERWVQQGIKLTANDSIFRAQQGYSVALSADGNTAIVGGISDNTFKGAAWIFVRSNGVWQQQGKKLVGTGAIGNAKQGYSVAISADGNTAVVGGIADRKDTTEQGAVWVYTRTDSVWTQQGTKLSGTGSIGAAQQGSSVSLNANGNTLIVAGGNDNKGKGAAWVFTRIANKWNQQGSKLVSNDANRDTAKLKFSVALNADGNIALIGGTNNDESKGAALIFTREGEIWSQKNNQLEGVNKIITTNNGLTVAMSADGSTVILGAPSDNFGVGSANVFVKLPVPIISNFTPTTGPIGTLVTITGTNFGNLKTIEAGGVAAVVISNSDTNLVTMVMPGTITAELKVTTTIGTGSSGNFSVIPSSVPSIQQGEKLIGFTGNAQHGYSVTISADGNTAVVGGKANVFIYKRTDGVWRQEGNQLFSFNSIIAQQTYSVAISADGNTIIGVKQVCINSTTKLLNEVLGGVWSSDKDSIATINSEGIITPVKVGTTTILYTVTNINGCKTVVKKDINVDSLPLVNAITGIQQTCKDGSTTFSTTTSGGVWSSNNTSIATIIDAGLVAQVNGINAGTATITYTVKNDKGCESKVTREVTINSKPLVPAINGVASVCTGTTLFLSNTMSGGLWSIDSLAIATINNIGELIPVKAGKVNVNYTVSSNGGCVSSVNKTIIVNNTPKKPVITLDVNLNLVSSSTSGNFWYKSTSINPIEVDTNKIYHPLINGRYKVRIKNADCWSDFSDEFVFITTPITMLYPNPVNSFVIAQIESENVKRIFLLLVDNSGNIIESKSILLNIGKNEIRFNTEKLAKGSYFIAIKNYKSSSKMFVK